MNSRSNIVKEMISEFEHTAIETIQNKIHREKKFF